MLRDSLVLDGAAFEPSVDRAALTGGLSAPTDPGQPFTLSPADLVFLGASDRFTKNIAALRLLKELERNGRLATHDERCVLAHYSAFGESALLNRLFRYDVDRNRFVVASDYADLLTEDEALALRRAALTAFYTPIDVIQTIWAAVARLGLAALDRPRIIEPAAGVGHFLSAMPADLRRSADITAVELDPLTARMLRQIHPDSTLHAGVGFEAVDLPSDWFDLAISNVPFGALPIHDPLVPDPLLRRTIHDYFFAKALRIVRPGGLIVFLTSWGTLDKQSSAVRAWLAERADLLGAFRLPNGVFQGMSGSASATDLLILQKKPTAAPSRPSWLEIAEADYPRTTEPRSMTVGSRYTREIKDLDTLLQEPVCVNRLWVDEPERVIGQPTLVAADSSLWLQVMAPAGGIASLLAERLMEHLPEAVITPWAPPSEPPLSARQARDLHARPDTLDLSAVPARHQDRAAALTAVYRAAKQLIRCELNDDPATEPARQALRDAYDGCVACYGVISDPRNGRLFADVPELAFLLALEMGPQQTRSGWRAEKARIFFERTLRPRRSAVEGTLTPTEAVLRCLDEIGALDMHRVAALCGLPIPQAIDQLGDRIFREPGTANYILADAYLSGNVRAKLRAARAWAERDAAYTRNVAALEAVQPAPLGPGDIILNLNSYWLPDDIVTDFIQSILPAFCGSAHYHASLAEWVLSDLADAGASSVEASSRWGTVRANAISILRACLRGTPITIYDEIKVGDTTRRVLNPAETVAAQEKQEAIKTAFTHWAWAEVQRAERLCALYNERFNSVRIRSYDGQHLTFPGMATAILRDGDLAGYQKGAVWQMLQNPTALLAHAVGAGKTFSAIAAMVEAKRMGLIGKALTVVPNTLVGQWASEARRLYPGIRVLAMAPEDFEKQRRGTVLSRIATGDWDIVVIAHTSFKFLPIGTAILDRFRAKETDRLRSFLEELRASATAREEKRSLKQIEKAILKFEARLEGMAASIKRDSMRTITWEELGIDMLVVDESHEFKNLFTPTKLTNIAGLPTANSQRALDMRIKTWDVQQRGGKVVFLTATPIMNTIGEAYVMQLYLQEAELEAAGITHFDEWVSLYAQPRMAFEMKPDGSGFRMNTRLNTFVNLPELAAQWRQVLNVKTKEQLKLPEPTLVTGKVIPVVVLASPQLKRYIQSLSVRVEAIRRGKVDPSEDNMLAVTGDGRKAALDIRLVLPGAERPRQSKILALVERVKRLYDTFDALRGTQLIFCDLSTPKGKGPAAPSADSAGRGASTDEGEETETRAVETAEETRQSNFVYYEIRDELVRRGVPAEEIAFIHEYQTRAARDALFAAMNEGRVRVLIGSTGKMGTGMNVQRRLIALHDLDCPWRPGDLEQRHGRILRQGNLWPSVYIFTYVTEGSFDGYMFQTIESKARFISQALAGEITARTVEDTAELVLSAAEVKAIASGNPLIVRKVQLETELARMERLRAVHLDTILALRRDRQRTEAAIAELEQRRQILEHAQHITHNQQSDGFTAAIMSSLGSERTRRYDKRAEAGSALTTIVEQYQTAATLERTSLARQVGSYRGLTLQVQAHPLFGLAIHLCLPDGTHIDELNAQSGAGLFASADSQIRSLPQRRGDVAETIRAKQQRTHEIDCELERLAVWEGQAAYEAATRALASINTTLTALETQEAAPSPAPAANGAPPSADAATAPDEAVSEETIAAVEALWNEADEVEPPLSIPPAVESLAFMEQELRWQAPAHRTEAAAETAIAEMKGEREADTPSTTPSSPHHRPPAQPRLVFGQPLPAPQRRSARAYEHRIGHQLDVFSALETHRHAPASPATERTQDHTLADPAAMEQRSLFD